MVFLKGPAALVPSSLDNSRFNTLCRDQHPKVFHSPCKLLSVTMGNPISRKSTAGIDRVACNRVCADQCQRSSAIDKIHLLKLLYFVFVVVLYDTACVYPEIFKLQFT